MRPTHTLLVLCLSVLALHCLEQPYRLVINDIDPNAKCLDGTSPGLYVH